MDYSKIDILIQNLAERNIAAYYFNSFDEAKSKLYEMIPMDATIGIGNSVTLKNMNISNELKNRGNTVLIRQRPVLQKKSKN